MINERFPPRPDRRSPAEWLFFNVRVLHRLSYRPTPEVLAAAKTSPDFEFLLPTRRLPLIFWGVWVIEQARVGERDKSKRFNAVLAILVEDIQVETGIDLLG